MNREQIIKAIAELRKHGLANGGALGYHAGWCDEVADTLEELTEENEALQKELIATQEKADKEYYELALEIDKVQSENELVKKFCGVDSNAVETFREYVCNRINRAKALTARKMQYMIQARCMKGGIYPSFVERTIENVAKELAECYEGAL